MTQKLKTAVCACAITGLLTACAGRDPQLVAAVQPQDQTTDCRTVQYEQQVNAQRIAYLGSESSNTTTQNVIAGGVGLLLFWPALFAMDFKNAPGQETAGLQTRQAYLASLAAQKCGATPRIAAGR